MKASAFPLLVVIGLPLLGCGSAAQSLPDSELLAQLKDAPVHAKVNTVTVPEAAMNITRLSAPDDAYLYIRLNKPNEGPASGECWMDHPNEPPIDDELWVGIDGPGYPSNGKYILKTKYKADGPGKEFFFLYRDLPSSGTYNIWIQVRNTGGGPAHGYFNYCVADGAPGRCWEVRLCHTDCGMFATCTIARHTITRP